LTEAKNLFSSVLGSKRKKGGNLLESRGLVKTGEEEREKKKVRGETIDRENGPTNKGKFFFDNRTKNFRQKKRKKTPSTKPKRKKK